MKHILNAKQFDREYIEKLFKQADAFRDKPSELLKGKILATLFYEPSTRTRLSFESAMLRLSGSVISTESANETSSATKGETLEDTARVVSGYAEVIVMRHPEQGSVARFAAASSVPVINAGDGGKGEHPTQALLDVYTIAREFGSPDGKVIAIAGALKYYRASRSLATIMANFKPAKVILVSPDGLKMDEAVKKLLIDAEIPVEETSDFDAAVKEADVLYQNRIPKEYFTDPAEYERAKNAYVLTAEKAASMKDGAIIMHPLPRVDEISPDVDASAHARYFEQAQNGVYVRMALLAKLL